MYIFQEFYHAGEHNQIYIQLDSSAPLRGASFLLLRRAEGPFGPKGDSGGRTNGRTDERTNGQTNGQRF